MDTEDLLHKHIEAICLIDGVSIGDVANRATWRIDFRPEASEQQRAAALAALASFDPNSLALVKPRLLAAIETKAGEIRCKYITTTPGQDSLYERKRREAEYVDSQGGNANPALCPVLSASVGIEAPTLADVAALVITKESQWAAIAAAIELRRLRGKKAVTDATTVAQAEAAFAAIDWSGL